MSSENKPPVLLASERLWNISNGLCEDDFTSSVAGLPELTDEEWNLLTEFYLAGLPELTDEEWNLLIESYQGDRLTLYRKVGRSPKFRLLRRMIVEINELSKKFMVLKRMIPEINELSDASEDTKLDDEDDLS